MMDFVIFLLAIINAMLIDNVVLVRFYGICPFLGVSKKTKSAFFMGLAVTIVIILAALIGWPLYHFVLLPAKIAFMDTIVYILVIASLVQIIGLFIKKFSAPLYRSLGIYLPLITTNCAVLGVVQGNTDMALSFPLALANAVGTGLGFLFVIVIFSFIRVRLSECDVPRAMKGVPIALFTAALLALAFLGFTGMIQLP